MFFFAAIVVLLAWPGWVIYSQTRTGFLFSFAMLLDQPAIERTFTNWVVGRSFLRGEFRGRKIVVLLQEKRGRAGRFMVVVSMETRAERTMETYDWTGYRPDRETELALFALEVDHELRLRHSDRCLKALWQPFKLFGFPGEFDRPKWQSVLEGMHMLAGSLERRAA